MKRIYIYLLLLGAMCLSACTTNVGVESSRHPVAVYTSVDGDFIGFIDGDMKSVFEATNRAIDSLSYQRTAQKVRNDSITVIARAVLDVKIVVDIKVEKPNTMKVIVNVDGGNLMKSQELFNTITRFARNPSM
ncbi:MAG: DUF3568 family protein [Opitutales bacterium]